MQCRSPLEFCLMKTTATLALVFLLSALTGHAQVSASQKPAASGAAVSTPLEIAKASVAAHGGDKFKNMKSLLVAGTVEIAGSPTYVIPGTFRFITAGDKYLFELISPMQSVKQSFDGKQTYSSGFELPPMTSLGFPLLVKAGEAGYITAALPETKKKKKGFRITTPDGFYTDFFVDEKTGQIKGYESSYDIDGNLVTTSVEIDEFQVVDGVTVPKKYSQRFVLGQINVYSSFNTKQILVNSTIPDDVFTVSK